MFLKKFVVNNSEKNIFISYYGKNIFQINDNENILKIKRLGDKWYITYYNNILAFSDYKNSVYSKIPPPTGWKKTKFCNNLKPIETIIINYNYKLMMMNFFKFFNISILNKYPQEIKDYVENLCYLMRDLLPRELIYIILKFLKPIEIIFEIENINSKSN